MRGQVAGDDPFREVRERLNGLDASSVAAGAAALSLIPSNAHRLGRLGHLAVLAGETDPGGMKRVTRGQLADLVNSGALAHMAASHDDPFEDVLVEEIAFTGGPRRLGSGMAENAVYVLRRLIPSQLVRGVLGMNAIAEVTRSRLLATMNAALSVSDRVVREVGPERHAAPEADEGMVAIPSASRLATMAAAVTFTHDQFDDLVGTDGRAALAPLIRPARKRTSPGEWIAGGEGDRWPLLAFGDTVIVAQPYAIAAALRHHVLCDVVAEAGVETTALAFGEAVDIDVRFSLARLGIRTTPVESRTAQSGVTVFDADLDRGLRLRCAVMADTMVDVAAAGLYGHYASDAANEKAERAFVDAAESSDGEVLGLLIQQSAGRGSLASIRQTAANLTTKVMSAADLETFAIAEAGDVLALWKFASESHALHEATRVMSFSAMDLYAQYRAAGRSLRSFHDATLVTVVPGSGAGVRCETKAGIDRHAAFYVDGTVREVEHDGAESWDRQIYVMSDGGESRVVRHVSGAAIDLWVRSPEGQTGTGFGHLVDTVAYWLAELTAETKVELELLAGHIPCFSVDVDLAAPRYWFEGGEPPEEDELGRYRLTRLGGQICLGSMIRRQLPTPDNSGERLLVGMLLDLLDETLRVHGHDGIADQRKRQAAEAVAPRGVKKHLLMMPGSGNELMEVAEEPARLIQDADSTAARQLLGRRLMEQFDLPAAAHVPDARRRDVVRYGVSFLLELIRAEVSKSSPVGLLDELIVASERIIAESERARAILPARAATYPGAVSAELLRNQAASINQAGVCCRFLVECVAAQPPSGTEPWSLRRYDRLMAICGLMLDWAYLDDAYEYEMSDNSVLINSDGELRLVELDRYELGRSAYYGEYIESQRRIATDAFASRFRRSDDESKSGAVLDRVNPAMRLETGASLTDLGELLHAANAYARSLEVDVVAVERSQAIEWLSDYLEWNDELVNRSVAYLTMGARKDLLKPPDGSYRDVVPSRFARRWSLNRRPFILRGEQLVWGRRQVLAALRVIVAQISSGRFRALAETDALREVVNAVGSEAGYAFEQEVADVVAAHVDKVRRSVSSVDGTRIRRTNGDDLGDIDVLAADCASKLLFAIECKDLAGALTPTEVAGELKAHFETAPGTSSSKHRDRTDWLTAETPKVLSELGILGDPSEWRVVGVFVTSTTVMAPYIKDIDFDIVPVKGVPAWIENQRRSVGRRAARHGKRRRRGRRGR